MPQYRGRPGLGTGVGGLGSSEGGSFSEQKLGKEIIFEM
jgi:hypothetical protein